MRDFSRVMRGVELHGLKGGQMGELERRWRKEGLRAVPSPSSVFRYLDGFHDEGQESRRVKGKAFIPAMDGHVRGFWGVNRDLLCFVRRHSPQQTAPFDMDATLVETRKGDALWGYKHFKAY